MKFILKTISIVIGAVFCAFVTISVINTLSTPKDTIETKDETTNSGNLIVEVVSGNELTIAPGTSASVSIDLSFDNVTSDGSFENGEAKVTYSQSNGETTTSNSSSYVTGQE